MLIRVSIITDIMVVIIWIGKKQIVFGKNKGAAHGNGREMTTLEGFFTLIVP